DCPFGKQFGLSLESTGLPVLGAIIFVGVVFERRCQWIFKVPEIRRRDRMSAGADLGLPPLLTHGNSAPDDLVDIGQREGDVIDPGTTRPIQNESIVVVADSLTTGEHTMTRIFIADDEIELLRIERAHGREIGSEHHHMPYVDRMRLVMNRRALVDALVRAWRIRWSWLDRNWGALADAESEAQPVRIGHARQSVGAGSEAGKPAQLLKRPIELLHARGAPDDFAHRVAALDRQRQVDSVMRSDDHFRAVA